MLKVMIATFAFASVSAAQGQALGARDLVGPRALAMGGALRAAATGAASVLLNPAAMSLAPMYEVATTYQYRGSDSASQLSAAVADSTTSRYVHAGLFYNFIQSNPRYSIPAGPVSQENTTHEFGMALSIPFRDWLAVGVTGRYLTYVGSLDGGSPEGIELPDIGAFSLDVGGVLRLGKSLTLAVVGYNLIPIDEAHGALYPQGLGLGASFSYQRFTASFDTVLDFSSHPDDKVKASYHGGLEAFVAERYALRGGAMHDTLRDSTFISAGLGILVRQAGAEFGFRQQIDGGAETLLSFALKLFLQ